MNLSGLGIRRNAQSLESLELLLLLPCKGTLTREQHVDFFERSVCCFGEETVCDGDPGHVQCSKEEQGPFAEIAEHDGDQESGPATAYKVSGLFLKNSKGGMEWGRGTDSPASDTEGVSLGADGSRPDFSRVDECDLQHCLREDPSINKDHCSGSGTISSGMLGLQHLESSECTGQEHGDGLDEESNVHTHSTSNAVDGEGGGGGGENTSRIAETGEPCGFGGVETGLCEEDVGVDCDGEDTGPFHHQHDSDGKSDTSAVVQVA